MFDNVKNWETQVKPLFESFGGVGREEVNSVRGYARYLCHLDHADRAQYNPNDVVCYGGADYKIVISLLTDNTRILKDVFAYTRINQIHGLAELLGGYIRKNIIDTETGKVVNIDTGIQAK